MRYALIRPNGYIHSVGGSPKLQRLPNGAIEITEEQFAALRRNLRAYWYRDGEVQPTDNNRLLTEAKAKVKLEIDGIRDTAIEAGFVYTFPDGLVGRVPLRVVRDVVNITGLGSASKVIEDRGGTATQKFHDMEEVTHTLGPSQVLDMSLAVQAFYTTCYEVGWSHKDALDPLTTLHELVNYNFCTGWPGQSGWDSEYSPITVDEGVDVDLDLLQEVIVENTKRYLATYEAPNLTDGSVVIDSLFDPGTKEKKEK